MTDNTEYAQVIAFPRRPRPSTTTPSRSDPLRRTPARLRWLDAVAAGTVTAYPCNVTSDSGHDGAVWYPQGRLRMTAWLCQDQVRPLWTPSIRFGNRRERVLRLTAAGRRLLTQWRTPRASGQRTGSPGRDDGESR